ncbi:MAG: FMN-binding negative transcriptional regulator [Sulfurimonas sp.]
MYIPEQFKIEDGKTIHEFIKSNPFATVVSTIDDRIEATHMPIERFQDGNYYGHLALNNIQSGIKETQEVLIIFTGPHAYISPTMYASEFNVPTWNYSAVHCYGDIEFIDDETTVWNLFHELVEKYEGKEGWRLPNEETFKNLTHYIRFFKFKIKRIEAKFKFNQNKSEEDIESVIEGLKGVGNKNAADFMKRITSN